ncbi:hypothetical protein [Aliarcobacter cryaerophilus]|uniref:hypothetical protein n=1 Tax=Aliarcobacter cryaerophilus TaxID=28198 RepID=UPI003DA455DD
MLIENTNLKENIEQLENILMELKESDELELIIEINYNLSNNRYLHLASLPLDTPKGTIKIDEEIVIFDNNKYYFYLFEANQRDN